MDAFSSPAVVVRGRSGIVKFYWKISKDGGQKRKVPGAMTAPGSDSFNSSHYARHVRLRKFEEHVRAAPRNLMNRTAIRSLGEDNQDIHVLGRLFGNGAYLSLLTSTGFTSTTDSLKLDARNDAVTVCLLKSGNAEISTGRDRFKLAAGDIYINATSDFRSTFGPTDVVRMIFPAGSQKELFRRTGEFVVLRNDDPVSPLLKAAMSGLDSALRDAKRTNGDQMSRIAVGLTSKVIEDHIFRTAISGYDIVRERAREYIHDNLASPNLNIGEIAEYVGASRATLYRAFEMPGRRAGLYQFRPGGESQIIDRAWIARRWRHRQHRGCLWIFLCRSIRQGLQELLWRQPNAIF